MELLRDHARQNSELDLGLVSTNLPTEMLVVEKAK